ncbi:hypothetical protein QE152_g5028 [Popillia japonica]|uniref:Uncharacterized protein n=1 Tax=Popillia japonica TaxID=7064 RepID=A0AAW1MQH0_POPJA
MSPNTFEVNIGEVERVGICVCVEERVSGVCDQEMLLRASQLYSQLIPPLTHLGMSPHNAPPFVTHLGMSPHNAPPFDA